MSKSKLNKKIWLEGTLRLKTGLHIGAGSDRAKIGGLDNPVIRNALNGEPYVPGSSLKGKIRSLLEQSKGNNCLEANNGDHAKDCSICQAFGNIPNRGGHASRIIFRDAYLTEGSRNRLAEMPTELYMTEIKHETAIDRVTGTVRDKTLRTTERVPAGVDFKVEIVVNVYDGDGELSEEELQEILGNGINLLNLDYLGGSGSRGYGQVELQITQAKAFTVGNGSFQEEKKSADQWKNAFNKLGNMEDVK